MTNTIEIKAAELKVGDVLELLGATHTILELEEYTGPLADLWQGERVRIARAAGGFGVTLGDSDRVRVVRPV